MSVEIDPFVSVRFPIHASALGRDVVFKVRVPTRRMRKEHHKLVEESKSKDNADELWALVKQGIESAVTGWEESQPFTFEAMESKLDDIEIIRLFRTWMTASLMSEDELGKSSSPPDATSA